MTQRFGADHNQDMGPESVQLHDENDQRVQAAVDALIRSGVTWGTHTDRWGDYEWQREFWTEVATVALTGAGVILPVQRCQTCIHPEGYDRLSGPCPTCGGDGVIPPEEAKP